MTDVHILAIDLAKRSFQVCGTALGGAVLFNRMVSRAKLETIWTSAKSHEFVDVIGLVAWIAVRDAI
jgi:hypothetical protein